MDKKFDSKIFDTPEFKSLETFIIKIYQLYVNKLADSKVFDPDNSEYVHLLWLNYQGIRTGLAIWLNLIKFIKGFYKRNKWNKEFIAKIQGTLEGLRIPLIWLQYREKENRQTSEATKIEKVNNYVDPNLVVEALLKET